VFAGLVLALIASIPQLFLCYERGSEWNGSFAYLDTDELAYCAYENSIIGGRPRRNAPYNGVDNQHFETLFSIQFVPPYVLAAIAKLFNRSASETFVWLAPIVVLLSCLVVFRLVGETTGNTALSAASSIAVLYVGSLAFLPILRKYVPAFPFPVCLAFFLLTWKSLTRRAMGWPICAALCFVVLVYSYFYLWTAAAAWFGLVLLLWLIGRADERKQTLRLALLAVITGLVSLLPYFWLISHRATTMDTAQVLERTHRPDLFRMAEIGGLGILLLLIWLSSTKKIDWKQPVILFVISLATAPVVIFNQQIISGRSLQPFHYTQFITNYMVIIAGLILLGIVWKSVPRWLPVSMAVAGCVISTVMAFAVARSTLVANVQADQKRGVAQRIKRENNDSVVFASDALLTMLIPTEARNPVLWSRYSYIFGDITADQRKRNYFKYLYYSGFDEPKFMHALKYDFTSRVEVFGAERTNPSLTVNHQEITEDELRLAYSEYAAYCDLFTRADAFTPTLGYAVVLSNVDLTNLERWYLKDQGERVGDFIIYKVSPK
jgi:hypothetical protein